MAPKTLYSGHSFTYSLTHLHTSGGCCPARCCLPLLEQFKVKCQTRRVQFLNRQPFGYWTTRPALLSHSRSEYMPKCLIHNLVLTLVTLLCSQWVTCTALGWWTPRPWSRRRSGGSRSRPSTSAWRAPTDKSGTVGVASVISLQCPLYIPHFLW